MNILNQDRWRAVSRAVVVASCLLPAAVPVYAAGEATGTVQQQLKEANEWKDPDTMFHMGGYAAVGFSSSSPGGSEFSVGSFSPIFHYLYRDKIMLESELEFELAEDGTTEVTLEYASVDLFLNDNMTVVAGKFLSPLGQFRQNMHPSWVNKMPSAPAGFGHDQAAPNEEVGAQLRGGFAMGSSSANYAVYIGNGPALELVATDIEKIETPGIGVDGDDNKVVGGRFGMYFPGAKLDIGLSAASGKASVWNTTVSPVTYGAPHDYTAAGVDLAYRPGNFEFRGEAIQQQVSDLPGEIGGTWQAWYLQGAYRPSGSSWEVVARVGQYTTPGTADDLQQAALGVNYLISNNAMVKLSYEYNENPNAGMTAADRMLLQLAYGF